MLAEGFEEIEALAFVDILRRAKIDVVTVSISDNPVVCGAHKISVVSDMCISELSTDNLDGVVLPGGIPGTFNLINSELIVNILNYAYESNKYIGAICAAPLVLGRLGFLKGKNATCYPGFENELTEAKYTGEKVVTDGMIITSKGAGTAQNFAHAFVSVLKGKDVADEIISAMQY